MRGLRITAPREAEIVDLPDPEPSSGEVRVRALRTAVSPGTELRQYRSVKVAGHQQRFPYKNGYCFYGVVESTGPDTPTHLVGQHVAVRGGPHDAYVVAPVSALTIMRPTVEPDDAVFMHLFSVAFASLRRGAPSLGDRVAVIGLGVIGLAAVAVAEATGLRPIGIDPIQRRRELATVLGAGTVIDPSDTAALADTVAAATHGEGIAMAVEAAASWRAVLTGVQIVRPRGTVSIVARHTEIPDVNLIADDLMRKEVSITTSYQWLQDGWEPAMTYRYILDLLEQGRLSPSSLITDHIAPDELPATYRRLDAGDRDIVGVVVDWE